MRASTSIVIPTRNGMKTLPGLFDALAAQPGASDVIVVDSGSTDGSAEFARTRGARVTRIAPDEFNHGSTRNMAVGQAEGTLVVLLVQDAIPASPSWLCALTAPFESDARLAGTYARQTPAAAASALTRWSLRQWQASSPAARVAGPLTPDAWASLTPAQRYSACLFDNVCACIRRDVWGAHPFRVAPIAEDLEWARDVLLAGYRLAYVPDALVWHSHERGPWYELQRTWQVHRRLQELFGLSTVPTRRALAAAVARTIPAHARVARREGPAALARAVALGVAWPAGQYLGARAARTGRPPRRTRGV
ncbi:MAG TPA: glycosyltransferase [Dehalococcoidia bacterium]|nr:glycosyltransferase [Dehalococcoidia bacterium]